MALEFSQVVNEMTITIVQSLDLDDYEAEYGEIVKIYSDWISEMVRLYMKDRYDLNLL